MKKIYRLGILGLGEGRSVISAALSSPHWEIGNICDLNESLCQQRCKEFGLTDYTTRYEDLLRDPQIDVIGIYTPDQLHSLHIRMALEAGKDVICTKPLMTSLEDANELLMFSSAKVPAISNLPDASEKILKPESMETWSHWKLIISVIPVGFWNVHGAEAVDFHGCTTS